tara:strand:+ start:636 stop:953 length:318 start_codon:yes stop_codon:yes gene_type:complete
MIDKLPAIKLTPEQARHFAVGKRAWAHHGWTQTNDGMLETMFQKSAMYQKANQDYGVIATFWCMTIDPEGVGALSRYEASKGRWVTKEIFAPVDPDEELMWDEEE